MEIFLSIQFCEIRLRGVNSLSKQIWPRGLNYGRTCQLQSSSNTQFAFLHKIFWILNSFQTSNRKLDASFQSLPFKLSLLITMVLVQVDNRLTHRYFSSTETWSIHFKTRYPTNCLLFSIIFFKILKLLDPCIQRRRRQCLSPFAGEQIADKGICFWVLGSRTW